MYMENSKQQLNTQIFTQQQQKLIDKLLNKRQKFASSKVIDPIYSQLFVVCEQNIKKKKKKRAKTLRNENTKIQMSSDNHDKQKALTQMKRNNRSFSYSNSIELPKIQKKYFNSLNQQMKLRSNVRKMQAKTQLSHLPAMVIKRQKNNQIARTKTHEKNQQNLKEAIKSQKRFNTQFNQRIQKKMQGKKTLNKKIKFQLNKKQSPLQKNLKQWKQIDILKLQTYFVKLKNLKSNRILTHSEAQLSKNITHTQNSLPTQYRIPDYIKSYVVKNTKINVDNLVRSQKFTVIYEEGVSLYFGGIQDGKRSGLGIYVSSNSRFQGLWKKGQKVDGYQITSNGYYNGRFKNNKRHGQGNFIWNNGQTYQGEWVEGFKNGLGVWKSGRGDSYIGQWVNGRVQGHGVHITSTGQRYQGEFQDFLKSGTGKQTFPNGDRYQGHYRQGNPDGRGKYEWRNNIVYIGEFKQGYRKGKGTIIAENYLKFQGNFDRDLPNGQGILQYQNGDRYAGDFLKGQKHGLGTFNIKSEQKILTGIWKNNKFQFDKQ